MRPGQCLFNALAALDPAFGEKLRESPSDPYFIDARFVAALQAWREHLVADLEREVQRLRGVTAPEVPDA